MKPTSIIFLILAVILMLAGFGLCYAANDMAVMDGTELWYSTDKTDNAVDVHDIAADTLNKISIKLKDADINVIGGSDRTYVELVNFNKNAIAFDVGNNILSIDDTDGLITLFRITENGIKFNGLRYYLSPDNLKQREKMINVYIADSEKIKIFELQSEKGDIALRDLSAAADYKVKLGEGSFSCENVVSTSLLELKLSSGDGDIRKSSFERFDVKIDSGDLTAQLSNARPIASALECKSGTIHYNGRDCGAVFNDIDEVGEPSIKMNVSVRAGNIDIKTAAE